MRFIVGAITFGAGMIASRYLVPKVAVAVEKMKHDPEGDARTMTVEGQLYSEDYGVEKDCKLLCKQFEKSLAAGDSDEMLLIGNLYYHQLGDYGKARECYVKAMDMGNEYAEDKLIQLIEGASYGKFGRDVYRREAGGQ